MSISERMATDIRVGNLRGEQPRPTKAATSPRTSWRELLARRIAVTDAVVLGITIAISLALKFGLEIQAVSQGPFDINYPTFAAMIAIAWLACLAAFGTRDARIVGDGLLEYRRVVRATTLMFGALAIASVLFKWDMSRGFLAISFPLGLLGLLLGRKAWRVWLCRQRRNGLLVSRVLVVGGHAAARRLARKFNGDVNAGIHVTGAWIPDRPDGPETSFEVAGESLPVVGSDFDVLEAIAKAAADSVIVTDTEHLGPDGMRELTWALEGVDVDLMVSPNLVDVSAPRMKLGRVGDEPFIHLQQPQYAEAGNAIKGFVDATAGLFLLVLCTPVILTAMVAIKASGPGPVLFRQARIGRNGHPFQIIKLRTMTTGADRQLAQMLEDAGKAGVPLFKLANDPRITRVGRFLRRYSIDELPQLINVIKGDMSLVGPRPQRDEEVSMYDHKAHRRLTVRPGMTGLWQVSGRSDLDWEHSVRLDLYYVENWSMTGDLMILWKTIRAVLRSEGAY